MKVYVIQSKNGIMINVGVSVKKLGDWGSCKNDYTWNPSTCDYECNKAIKIDKYLDTKNCLCERRLVRKLVLPCKDETLTATKNSLDDKKVTCKKIIFLSTQFH